MTIKIKSIESASASSKELTKESILSEYSVLSKLHNECVIALDRMLMACDQGATPAGLRDLHGEYRRVQELKEAHMRTMERSVQMYFAQAMEYAENNQMAEATVPEETNGPVNPSPVCSCVKGH